MQLNIQSAVACETTARQHHSASTTRTSLKATSSPVPDTRTILRKSLRMSKFLFTLLLLWTAVVIPRNETNSLEFPFTLVVGNLSVIPPIFGSNGKVEPQLGEKAAIFHLKDGRLTSDQHPLTRTSYQHLANYPQPVYWFKHGQNNPHQSDLEITAKGNDDGSLQVYLFGAPLIGYPSTRRLEADTTYTWVQDGILWGADAAAVHVKPVK